MADTNDTQVLETEPNDTQKYLDTINELKKNSVSRAEYDKIRNENKTLLEAIVNGRTEDAAADTGTTTVTTQELRNKLFGKTAEDLTDIEFIGGLVELRNRLIEEEGVDYGAPTGSQLSADFNDTHSSQKVADALAHCLEVADGDNDIFIQEITRITSDVGAINKKIKRR